MCHSICSGSNNSINAVSVCCVLHAMCLVANQLSNVMYCRICCVFSSVHMHRILVSTPACQPDLVRASQKSGGGAAEGSTDQCLSVAVKIRVSLSVVLSRLTDHLSSINLLNSHQSSYSKHHSTKAPLLYIYDHLINAVGCLDLSAAFDTIDHNILITYLSSWFWIQGSVLKWFKSCHHHYNNKI